MFDYVCIFTTGGVLLWSKAFYATNFNIELINIFIKSMLLENTQSAKKQFSYQDNLLKWQINQELNVVFTVVYKESLLLAFVDQFIDLLSKAFTGVYKKALQSESGLTRDEVFLRLIANPEGMFGPHYRIVYEKWDSLVKNQLTAPKKMRTFAETSKGKKLNKKGKKGGQSATTAGESGK